MNKPYVIRRDDHDSIPMGRGVRLSYLRKEADEYSILLQMDEGGTFPIHEHVGGEEIFVIEGQVQIGDVELHQGDYYYLPSGVSQKTVATKGCTLWISSAKGLEGTQLKKVEDSQII